MTDLTFAITRNSFWKYIAGLCPQWQNIKKKYLHVLRIKKSYLCSFIWKYFTE